MSDSDDATMPDTRATTTPSSARLRTTELGDRYEVLELLGRGGMGEVRLARDRRIDREVAVKRMHQGPDDEATLARFFREARVQGRLEHPAVVPIHDLGRDPEGHPYFVMKRLEGTTLADLLATSDPQLRAHWPRRKLLSRFVDICLAIQFAHDHNVIHRDLKPANLMLGEHGEAYVLDWGLARVLGDHRIEGVAPTPNAEPGATQAGELMGTPGYMSPEQARGEQVDGRTDVFALGCVLYEILTGKPALPRGVAGIQATLDLERLLPSEAGVEVPFELDKLCARATAADRKQRPTARMLADELQGYLDGDRDQTARRQAAAAMVATATAAFERVIAAEHEARQADRAIAMREAGRALALEPTNQTALDIVAYLRQEVPKQLPPEVIAAADDERAAARQKVLRWARGAIGMLIGIEVGLLFVPLHVVWPVVLMIALSVPVWLLTYQMGRHKLPMDSRYFPVFVIGVSLSVGAAGIVLGPLFVMPIFIIGGVSGFVAQPTSYSPWWIVGALQAPTVVLVVLETTGVLPSTFAFRDGSFVLTTWVFELTPTVGALLLGAALVVQTINSTLVAVFQRRAQEAAQNRVHAHQWHLRKLLPEGSPADDSAREGRA